jgi:hypothetical protein
MRIWDKDILNEKEEENGNIDMHPKFSAQLETSD